MAARSRHGATLVTLDHRRRAAAPQLGVAVERP
jgi:hypothetical protein